MIEVSKEQIQEAMNNPSEDKVYIKPEEIQALVDKYFDADVSESTFDMNSIQFSDDLVELDGKEVPKEIKLKLTVDLTYRLKK